MDVGYPYYNNYRAVSVAFSKPVLNKIDQEARIQGRTRSSYIELHFAGIFKVEQS